MCRKLKLPVAESIASELLQLFKLGPTRGESEVIEKGAQQVINIIEKESRTRIFLFVLPEKVSFYKGESLFGQSVDDAFPSAKIGIEEAGKCFAMGRNTACVFHLMRVLEVALNALAKKFCAGFEHSSWGKIIDGIEAKITDRTIKSDDERFYSEAASHLRLLKNAWRNYVMHEHDTYDEERAQRVWNHVQELMEHLATKLSE